MSYFKLSVAWLELIRFYLFSLPTDRFEKVDPWKFWIQIQFLMGLAIFVLFVKFCNDFNIDNAAALKGKKVSMWRAAMNLRLPNPCHVCLNLAFYERIKGLPSLSSGSEILSSSLVRNDKICILTSKPCHGSPKRPKYEKIAQAVDLIFWKGYTF